MPKYRVIIYAELDEIIESENEDEAKSDAWDLMDFWGDIEYHVTLIPEEKEDENPIHPNQESLSL